MSRFLQGSWIAASLHLALYLLMWILYWATGAPLLDGLSRYPFVVLFFADLPISLPAFSVIFTSEERGIYAAILSGLLGTLMWYFIGRNIDSRRQKSSA